MCPGLYRYVDAGRASQRMTVEKTRRGGNRVDVQEGLPRVRRRCWRRRGWRCGCRSRRLANWCRSCGCCRYCGRRRNWRRSLLRRERYDESLLGHAVVEPDYLLEVRQPRLARLERPRFRRVDVDGDGQAGELPTIGAAYEIDTRSGRPGVHRDLASKHLQRERAEIERVIGCDQNVLFEWLIAVGAGQLDRVVAKRDVSASS